VERLSAQQGVYKETLGETKPAVLAARQAKENAELALAADEKVLGRVKTSQSILEKRTAQVKASKPKKVKGKYTKVEEVEDDLFLSGLLLREADKYGGVDGRTLAIAARLRQQAAEGLASINEAQAAINVAEKIADVAKAGKWVTTELPDGTKLSPYWSKVIDDAFEPVDQLLVGGDGAIAKEVAEGLRNVKVFASDDNSWEFVDTLTRFFKTYATATPGFHVRNAMSASFMNASDGVKLEHQKRGLSLWRQSVNGGKDWLEKQPEDIQQAFRAVYMSGGGGGQYSGAELGNRYTKRAGKLLDNPVTRTSRRWGGDWVEGPVRLGMALDSIANGQDVFMAAARIERIHFNYSATSTLDKYARRLIPFWTFMSRNLPMQIQQMWMKPRAYAVYNHLTDNFDLTEDGELMPKWMKDIGGFTVARDVGWMGGKDLVLTPDLQHSRLEQELGDPMGMLGSVTPYLRVPTEMWANKRAFTGGPVFYDDNPSAGQQADYLAEQLLPPYAQGKRLLAMTGTHKGKGLERRANWAGIPIKGVGEEEWAREARRRALEAAGG
jgi:hypothetical protein